MLNPFELLLYAVCAAVGVFIMCFCCAALTIRIRSGIQSSNSSRRSRLFFNRASNKTDDDPPPIFSITTMSVASSSSRMGDHNHDVEFVDISIEEQPPPQYDDIIVVKPTNLLKSTQ